MAEVKAGFQAYKDNWNGHFLEEEERKL